MAAALTPWLLAGLLALEPAHEERWPAAGAWLFPVGDPYDLSMPDPDGAPGFEVSRGLSRRADRHDGADLLNGRGGDVVRAAAHGLVVVAEASGHHGGYGAHVVLAHRDGDGTLHYTVYAHLEPGSPAARAGDAVVAGAPLGRVGRSGRASTEHLHFEVLAPAGPGVRWERARRLEPLEFVRARLPRARADSAWSRPYVEWAELAALIGAEDPGHAILTRPCWRRMLERAIVADASAGDTAATDAPAGPMTWRELCGDLERARARGLRLEPPALDAADHRDRCASGLGLETPLRELGRLARRNDRAPTVAEACALLCEVARERATRVAAPPEPARDR